MIIAQASAVVSTLGAALLGTTSVTLVSAAVSTLVSGGVLALGTTIVALVSAVHSELHYLGPHQLRWFLQQFPCWYPEVY